MSDMLRVASNSFCASLYGLQKPSNNRNKNSSPLPTLSDNTHTHTNKLKHSHFQIPHLKLPGTSLRHMCTGQFDNTQKINMLSLSLYIYIHTHTHTHTYIYIYINTHIHVHTVMSTTLLVCPFRKFVNCWQPLRKILRMNCDQQYCAEYCCKQYR